MVREKSLQRTDEALFEEALKGRKPSPPLEIGSQKSDPMLLERELTHEKKGVTAESNGVKSSSSAKPEAERAASPAMAVEPVKQWLEQVTEKCSSGGSEPGWSMLVQTGKRLPATERYPHVGDVVDHVERLAEGGHRETECRAIMKIIKERHGN